MAPRPNGFVVLADMRTGSNLLQERIGLAEGVTCHGELFNPSFIDKPGTESLFGLSIAERDADPVAFLERSRAESAGLSGFRLFPGHDARILAHVLKDRQTAKIVLTRNPLESYVSLKTAQETGQWWLGDLKMARSARPEFDAEEFAAYLDQRAAFYEAVRHALQVTGQTAFHIHYDDLSDDRVMAGLFRFLGAKPDAVEGVPKARVQNPEPLLDRVANPEAIEGALGRIDPFDASRLPDFEPRRGANVPAYVIAERARLLYLPVPGVGDRALREWLGAVNSGEPLREGLTRKGLRQWKRGTPGHRSFAVIGHPARRAWRAFCLHILAEGPDRFSEIRRRLEGDYGVALPEPGDDVARHRAAFLGFLRFLKGNLGGQTSLRVPAVWASQSSILRGVTDAILPDAVLRQESLSEELGRWSGLGGAVAPEPEPGPVPFAELWDDEIEQAARAAYPRDFMMFGFGPAA